MSVITYRAATLIASRIYRCKDCTRFKIRRIFWKWERTLFVADNFAFFITYCIMVWDTSGFFNILKLADSLQLCLKAIFSLSFLPELLLSLLKVPLLLSDQGHLILSFQDNHFEFVLCIINFSEFFGQYYFEFFQKIKKFLKLFSWFFKL